MLTNGIPESVLTVQGTNYQSTLLAELYSLLNIKRVRTSPYHPQSDGMSERTIQTMTDMIATYANNNQDNWDELLLPLSFALNTSEQATTEMTA